MQILPQLCRSQFRSSLLAVAVLLAALCSRAQSQPILDLPPEPVSAPPVDAIEERLRELEEKNQALTWQLQQTNQALHDLELSPPAPGPFSEESGQFAVSSPDAVFHDGLSSDQASVPTGDYVSPVPDYTDGRFAPFALRSDFFSPSPVDSGRAGLHASFGPGFQLQTQDKQFSL
jgi:hypothetical protein